jgi:hypothetical protein
MIDPEFFRAWQAAEEYPLAYGAVLCICGIKHLPIEPRPLGRDLPKLGGFMEKGISRRRLCTRLGVLLLMTPFLTMAQSDRGDITGTVSDPANAIISNASLSLRNSETGAIYQTKTTASGNYTLASLPAGAYELTVSSPGFRNYLRQGILVQVGTTVRIDVTLQVGTASESVTVTANAPMLKTESAEQSFNISVAAIDDLPLTQGSAGLRNPIAFAQLTPSMSVPATNTFGNLQARVNGLPDSSFRVLVDGQDITNSIDPSHLSESHPSIESIQEVQLTASNFAAEFGRVGGGLFNFTSRSGSNQFHGSGYEYLTNEDFGAGQPFTSSGNGHLLRPQNRSHDFGFSVGGPVFLPKIYSGRNRTFFFFNLEEWRLRASSSGGTFSTIPTAAYRQGNFSSALTGRTLGMDPLGNPILENMIYDPLSDRLVNGQTVRSAFPDNTIPLSRIDPVAAKIQALIPMATNSALVNNYGITDSYTIVKPVPSIKVDHYFGPATKVSFYWSEWRQDRSKNALDGLPQPISPARIYTDRTPTYRFNVDRTVTPTFLVHFGAGLVHYQHLDSAPEATLNYDAVAKLGLVGSAKTPAGMPTVTGLSANSNGGMSSNVGTGNGSLYHNDKPTTVLNGTWIRGNHTYKAGAEWQEDIWTSEARAAQVGSYAFSANQTGQPYLQTTNIGGGSVGFPYASFLLGTVNTASVSNFGDGQWRKHNFGFFVQDTWKITRKLTLDYGVRWDYQTAFHEIYNRDARFAPFTSNPSAGGLPGATEYEGTGQARCNCQFTNTYPYALGPRLGVAYQFLPKTVLRAAWGLIYSTTPSVNYQLSGAIGTGFNTLAFSNGAFGEPALQFQNGLQYNPASLYVASFDPGIRPLPGQINSPPNYENPGGGRPGRINEWNISIQREISNNLVVEAAYVGNRGVWLQGDQLQSFNVVTPQRLSSYGINVNSQTDRALLILPVSSAQVQSFLSKLTQGPGNQSGGHWATNSAGIVPYAGFPVSQTLAQALRPYPQFGTVNGMWVPDGNSWYDSLQVKITKRFSRGLSATYAFTWQKELTLDAQGSLGVSQEPEAVNDITNRYLNKYISKNSLPFESVVAFSYQAPVFSSNRWVRSIVRDWTVGGVLRYASGLPIQAPLANNNLSSILFQSTFANRVPGVPLFTKDLNCHCIDPKNDFVLNPGAWSDPAPGQFGTAAAYYNDYRYQRRPAESASLGRIFRIREGMSLAIRAEFFNVFNRTEINNPTSTNALATQTRNAAGVPTGGFGYINPGSLYSNPRTGQLVARFQF